MTNEPQKIQLDIEKSIAFTACDEDADLKKARKLTEEHLARYNKILNEFDEEEEVPPDSYLARTRLRKEFDHLERWGRDIGLYQYEKNTPKYAFSTLPSVTKLSIIDSLEAMDCTMRNMRGTVNDKKHSWAERHHKLVPPESDCRARLARLVNLLRCIVIELELLVDPEDEIHAREGDARTGIKALFRSCATDFTIVFKRIEDGDKHLKNKLRYGHLEGPRNDFIMWGREAGVLLGDEISLEAKVANSDRSESRNQIVETLVCVKSALKAMFELLPEKRVLGEDLAITDADDNSNSTLSLTERAKTLEEQIAVLHQYNESLVSRTKNIGQDSLGSNSFIVEDGNDTATYTRQ